MTNKTQTADTVSKSRLTGASFTLKNRLLRVVWDFTCLLVFRYTPRPLHVWRVFVLRCFGAQIGQHCHVYPKVKIWAPWNLVMYDYACLANEVTCYTQGKITLHERAIVSQGAHLCTGTHDYNDPDFSLYARPIEIGKDAWVCAEAFIGPGVTVGEGAVLGARAVAFKDLQAWQVYSGNPAQAIKQRQIKASKHEQA
ncbi:MAG: putative colanic acid biosynthesis acetyltransferase [Methylobacter sp.]|nr:putative colanic acid biosynthesis acetyltransferase [Methylobacter sp.]